VNDARSAYERERNVNDDVKKERSTDVNIDNVSMKWPGRRPIEI